NTTGPCIERVDGSIVASEEQPASHYGGLAENRADRGEPEGPLDLQLRNIFGTNSGRLDGLHAAIDQIDAPSVPAIQIGERPRVHVTCVGMRRLDGRGGRGRQEI